MSFKSPEQVESSPSKASQTVTVSFPGMRAIYVDGQNNIVSILSNSPVISDEMLAVYRNGVEMPLYEEIKDQYDELLDEVDWDQVGWVYNGDLSQRHQNRAVTSSDESEGVALTGLEQVIYDQLISENIFPGDTYAEVLKSQFPPNVAPHKDSYSVRATVFDIEEDVKGVSIEYL
jgi:hypothetical protein